VRFYPWLMHSSRFVLFTIFALITDSGSFSLCFAVVIIDSCNCHSADANPISHFCSLLYPSLISTHSVIRAIIFALITDSDHWCILRTHSSYFLLFLIKVTIALKGLVQVIHINKSDITHLSQSSNYSMFALTIAYK